MEVEFQKISQRLLQCSGTRFFDKLPRLLAEEIKEGAIMLGWVNQDNRYMMNATVAKKNQAKNRTYSYSILNEPCEKVVVGGDLIFIDNIQKSAALCSTIRKDGWNTYAAVPIKKSNGEIAGILAMLDSLFLGDVKKTLQLLEKIVQLAGIELHHRELSNYFSRELRTCSQYKHVGVVNPDGGSVWRTSSTTAPTGNQLKIVNRSPIYRKNNPHPVYYVKTGVTIETNDKPEQQTIMAARENCLNQLIQLAAHDYSGREYLHRALTILTKTIEWLPATLNNIAFLADEQMTPTDKGEPHPLADSNCYQADSSFISQLQGTSGAQYCAEEMIEKNLKDQAPRGHYYVAIRFEKELLAGLRLELHPTYIYQQSDETFLRCASGILSLGLSRLFYKKKINYMRSYDPLTSLPNRKHFLKNLTLEKQCAEIWQHYGVVFFIDMDRFKALNDALGSKIGDQILTQIALRLKDICQHNNHVARLGADEFALLLPCLAEDRQACLKSAISLAQQVLKVLSAAYHVAEQPYQLTASIGISVFDHQPAPPEELLHQADTAMGTAKLAGGDCYMFFCPDMQKVAEHRVQLESYLHSALDKGEMSLVCQPQVNPCGVILGCEFLIRWNHPDHGTISPANFIPIAEESGIIKSIDSWVMRKACETFCAWHKNNRCNLKSVSVNVSPQLFHEKNFTAIVDTILQQTAMPRGFLIIELTESILISDMEGAIKKIDYLHQQGVRFSIDDFGTGYSSLSYLRRLNIDELKIDQSFIREIVTSPDDAAIVSAITTLARQFSLSVVAEGVENEAQYNWLKELGCDLFQGYLFSKPLTVATFSSQQGH